MLRAINGAMLLAFEQHLQRITRLHQACDPLCSAGTRETARP